MGIFGAGFRMSPYLLTTIFSKHVFECLMVAFKWTFEWLDNRHTLRILIYIILLYGLSSRISGGFILLLLWIIQADDMYLRKRKHWGRHLYRHLDHSTLDSSCYIIYPFLTGDTIMCGWTFEHSKHIYMHAIPSKHVFKIFYQLLLKTWEDASSLLTVAGGSWITACVE